MNNDFIFKGFLSIRQTEFLIGSKKLTRLKDHLGAFPELSTREKIRIRKKWTRVHKTFYEALKKNNNNVKNLCKE